MARDGVLIGLTGSIGAGKSTVADVFEENGIPVLRADDIARELMEKDPALRAGIVELFGPAAYVDGKLDRRLLASRIFSNDEERERLNDLVHPRTIAEQGRRAARLFNEGAKIVACEAALIFETGGEERFDYIVVVDAEPEVRLRRAAERSGGSIEEMRRRDQAQIPAATKVDQADFVIRNDGAIDELRRAASFIASLLKALPQRSGIEDVGEEEEGEEGEV